MVSEMFPSASWKRLGASWKRLGSVLEPSWLRLGAQNAMSRELCILKKYIFWKVRDVSSGLHTFGTYLDTEREARERTKKQKHRDRFKCGLYFVHLMTSVFALL